VNIEEITQSQILQSELVVREPKVSGSKNRKQNRLATVMETDNPNINDDRDVDCTMVCGQML